MKQSPFTDKEKQLLSENPYTYRVTDKHLSFTSEFKKLFWAEYCKGSTPAQILRKYGYDPDLLGPTRVTGIQQTIRREASKNTAFYSGRRPSPQGLDKEDTAASLKKMQHEIQYLRQEVEYLKKIYLKENTRK